jgi:hypothetical protein
MSAVPPIATELVTRGIPSLGANSGLMQCSREHPALLTPASTLDVGTAHVSTGYGGAGALGVVIHGFLLIKKLGASPPNTQETK